MKLPTDIDFQDLNVISEKVSKEILKFKQK